MYTPFMDKPPGREGHVRGVDERNIAGIALIPSQTRLPKGKLIWERRITSAQGLDLTVNVEGNASVGLPHGLDNDILVSLINAYVEEGCPGDRTITTSAYRLLSAPGLATTKFYYDALHLSLRRLQTAAYTITNGWYDAKKKRYTDVMFSILDNVEQTRDEDGFDERTTLRLTLNKWVANSVQQGYFKPLNLKLYRALDSVATRNVYRLLDAYLFEVQERGEARPLALTVDILAWAVNCGLLMETPDKIRRALDPIHADLIKHGFLDEVRYLGRGKKQRIEYRFGSASAPAQKEHVDALKAHGVHHTLALKYARELGADALKVAAQFELHKQNTSTPIKNEAGYLVTMLKQPAEHIAAYDGRQRDGQTAEVSRRQVRQRVERQVKQDVVLAERQVEEQHEELDTLTPAAAHERLLTRLRLFGLAPLMSVQELELFRAAILNGHVKPSVLLRSLMRAALPGADKQQVARNLLTLLL